MFLLGLRDVVEANGGVGDLSKGTKLNRENLYRLLSKEGNPRLSSLSAILESVGLQIHFTSAEAAYSKVVVVIGEDELATSINPLHIISVDDFAPAA